MDIRQLRYFITIAEEGQITSAAKRLNMAQPPLSQQLKLLEEELGVKLVERGSRSIQLTDAGKELKKRADHILELTDTAVKELKDFNNGLKGTLSIGTVSSSGATFLPERIQKFNENFPQINFEIWEGNTYRILEILNSGIIEIGVVRTPFNMGTFDYIYMPLEPMIAVSVDMQEFSSKDYIELADLANKPLIIYRRFENLIIETFEKSGFKPNIICKTDDARSTLLWAESGIGIALVPKAAIKLVGSTTLKYKPINEKVLQTQIAAIWVKNRYLSTAAKHFLKTFKGGTSENKD
ncbi:LysR family transcriptional regulator [Clostridium folliculivorans]|uniref:LysR family transcriptional regulator n=1 Tax=Clostridium folliculivorans TaxID=2886038 RepID=A0A9W5Y4T3_9CLOT|nr:LysR family transcriptional regulator [Clostridium folliculivorans]GKU26666.1 LysR family transcriptional regulator [Clostridium folliculivorans]GKU28902.1 LysR family transcriptional regulator [Clostridium folliculivorans]